MSKSAGFQASQFDKIYWEHVSTAWSVSLVTYQAIGLVELGSFTASDNLKAHLFDEFRITTDYFLKVSHCAEE